MNLYSRLLLALCTPFLTNEGLAAEIAITGATIYTATETAGSSGPFVGTVLVDGGRIVAVGTDVAIPAGAARVDGRGATLTPGLFHSITSLGVAEIGLEPSTVDNTVHEFPMGPSFEVAPAINPASAAIPVARLAGITHAMVMPTPGNDVFAGWAALLRLDQGTDSVIAPNAALLVALGAGSGAFAGGSRAAAIVRIRQAFADAQRYNASRYRAEPKGYGHHDLVALKRFLTGNRPLVVSAGRASDIRQAVTLAERLDKPLIVIGATEAWQVADLLADHAVDVVIDPFSNVPRNFDALGARLDNAKLLVAAGVRVAFTSGRVERLRYAAGLAVANGLPWAEGLAAITRAPAAIWGLTDGGTLAPGQRADMVLWDGDPLEVTSWAKRVMIGGRWMPTHSRQSRLRTRYSTLEAEPPLGHR